MCAQLGRFCRASKSLLMNFPCLCTTWFHNWGGGGGDKEKGKRLDKCRGHDFSQFWLISEWKAGRVEVVNNLSYRLLSKSLPSANIIIYHRFSCEICYRVPYSEWGDRVYGILHVCQYRKPLPTSFFLKLFSQFFCTCTIFNTASFANPQIPLYRRIVELNPGLLHCLHGSQTL